MQQIISQINGDTGSYNPSFTPLSTWLNRSFECTIVMTALQRHWVCTDRNECFLIIVCSVHAHCTMYIQWSRHIVQCIWYLSRVYQSYLSVIESNDNTSKGNQSLLLHVQCPFAGHCSCPDERLSSVDPDIESVHAQEEAECLSSIFLFNFSVIQSLWQ